MILLLLIGYVVAYALVFMMFVAFCCAVVISFTVYTVAYMINYAWQAVRHRRSPEWRYKRATFKVNDEKVQAFATGAGIVSMILMILGFFIYAFTESWNATLGWCGGLGLLAALVAWDQARTPNRFAGHAPTYGEIRDKHDV